MNASTAGGFVAAAAGDDDAANNIPGPHVPVNMAFMPSAAGYQAHDVDALLPPQITELPLCEEQLRRAVGIATQENGGIVTQACEAFNKLHQHTACGRIRLQGASGILRKARPGPLPAAPDARRLQRLVVATLETLIAAKGPLHDCHKECLLFEFRCKHAGAEDQQHSYFAYLASGLARAGQYPLRLNFIWVEPIDERTLVYCRREKESKYVQFPCSSGNIVNGMLSHESLEATADFLVEPRAGVPVEQIEIWEITQYSFLDGDKFTLGDDDNANSLQATVDLCQDLDQAADGAEDINDRDDSSVDWESGGASRSKDSSGMARQRCRRAAPRRASRAG